MTLLDMPPTASAWEYAAREWEPSRPRWDTPGAMAEFLDHRTVQTPALELIDQALVKAMNTPDARLILSMPPQEGKSQRASRRFPLWALTQNPDLRIAIAGYEANIARRWGRAIRDDIMQHSRELGLSVRPDLSAQHEWQLDGHEGGVFTAGIGGALTGRPVDMLVIDDPVKDRKQADSPTYRQAAWDWWTDTAMTRLAPGAPVIVILTRWHHDDLAGRLLAAEDGHIWEVLNIPAQADHRPEDGQTDPLGREPGEFMVSARGRTEEQWEARKVAAGPRTWASLFQGRPSPKEGGILPGPSQWARYSVPMWHEERGVYTMLDDSAEVVMSWDLTFKDTDASDYVVGQVWARIGTRAYLVDQVRGRWDFTETCRQFLALAAKWPQAVAKFVEDKANGPAVINVLSRTLVGIIPVEPEGSKTARAHAVSPLAFAGNIVLPDEALCPWVAELTTEATQFPNGPHDDQVDALTQGTNRILLMPLDEADGLVVPDVFDDDEDEDDGGPLGWAGGY